jgi:hypothetical protein
MWPGRSLIVQAIYGTLATMSGFSSEGIGR